jgi:hypothetical protein
VRRWVALGLCVLAVAASPSRSRAQAPHPLSDRSLSDMQLSDESVLAPVDMRLRIESLTIRITGYDQFGRGYQSKAGPIFGPGDERVAVLEPQGEIIATQGDRITHRVWVPIDVVSAASPVSYPKVDVMSGASRKLEAGTLQWTTTYKTRPGSDIAVTSGLHLENPFRSWNSGLHVDHALADQNTVISGAVAGILDWFDRFTLTGARNGRAERSSTMGSVGLTQVLTPTTLAHISYGLTLQVGELGNTWNIVPLTTGVRGAELLPSERARHAIVGRMSQFLPWNGALRLYYRLYADDWGIVAHSMEGQLLQRLSERIYVGALYRFHTQTGPYFFTTRASPDGALRVADSDLAPLESHTVGGKIVADGPGEGFARTLHYELEVDRYVRNNDLSVDMVSCALGLRF